MNKCEINDDDALAIAEGLAHDLIRVKPLSQIEIRDLITFLLRKWIENHKI